MTKHEEEASRISRLLGGPPIGHSAEYDEKLRAVARLLRQARLDALAEWTRLCQGGMRNER